MIKFSKLFGAASSKIRLRNPYDPLEAGKPGVQVGDNGVAEFTRVPLNNSIRGIASSPTLTVVVGLSSSSVATNYYQTSPDGVTWTGRTFPLSAVWLSVVYSAGWGRFIALAESGINYYSTDGISWTAGATASLSGATSQQYILRIFKDVAYVFSTATGVTQYKRSTDGGVTWSAHTLPIALGGNVPSCDEDYMFAVTTMGAVYYTTDGVNWTQVTSVNNHNWSSVGLIAPCGGSVVVFGYGYANRIGFAVSSDIGATWSYGYLRTPDVFDRGANGSYSDELFGPGDAYNTIFFPRDISIKGGTLVVAFNVSWSTQPAGGPTSSTQKSATILCRTCDGFNWSTSRPVNTSPYGTPILVTGLASTGQLLHVDVYSGFSYGSLSSPIFKEFIYDESV